jgi:uncharacterized membrane protein HdeD (DUF308 family)
MNNMKLRLLLMGCILIIIGTALYFVRGADTLVLTVIGVALLIGGIIYPNRETKAKGSAVMK